MRVESKARRAAQHGAGSREDARPARSPSSTARSRRSSTSISTSREKQVTALIGPSGCGKSTFLRCLNRMNDTIDIARVTGKITLDGEDIYDPGIDVVELRARVGMVFQKPNPFPKSIFENVAYGPRIHGLASEQGGPATRSSNRACRGPALLERGEGPAARAGHRPFRRPAAAALHRPRHRRQPGGDPDGRAVLGARPDRHRQGRGADRRAPPELHHRHRHPFDAAGGARLAAHGDVPSRLSRRGGADRQDVHQPRRASARRTTSPAASAERTLRQRRGDDARAHRHVLRRGPRGTSTRSIARDGRPAPSSMVERVHQRAARAPTMRSRPA